MIDAIAIFKRIFKIIGQRPTLALVLLAGSCSGTFSVLVFPHLVTPLKVHYMMADGYYPIAQNILAGNGFEMGGEPRFDRGAFKREPLYPLFLAALLATRKFVPALLTVQILLYIITVLVAYRVFTLWGQPGVAYWAAVLFALHPYAYWYVAKPTPENFSPLILLLNIWACQSYLANRKIATVLVWGGLCGVAILVKSQLMILFPIGVLLLIITFGVRRSIVPTVVAALVLLATLSPWAVRNYCLSRKVMVSSSMFGTSFFVGNENASWETIKELSFHRRGETMIAADWKARYAQIRAHGSERAKSDKYVVEATIDSEYSREVLPWIISHKATFLRKLLINASILWFIADEPAKSVLIGLSMLPVMTLALLGIWNGWKRNRTAFQIHLISIVCVLYASYSAILAMGRYMHVSLAIECYFAIAGAQALVAWRRGRQVEETPVIAFERHQSVAGRAL